MGVVVVGVVPVLVVFLLIFLLGVLFEEQTFMFPVGRELKVLQRVEVDYSASLCLQPGLGGRHQSLGEYSQLDKDKDKDKSLPSTQSRAFPLGVRQKVLRNILACRSLPCKIMPEE